MDYTKLELPSAQIFLEYFVFFDDGNLIVVANGFQKKTPKSPKGEIERAERIRKEYYVEKD